MSQDSKYEAPKWETWSPVIINSLQLKKTAQDEFHGSCPNCGGKDRFWIKKHDGLVSVNCRQCNDFTSIADIMRGYGLLPQLGKMNGASTPIDTHSDFDNHAPYHVRKGIELLGGATLVGEDVVVPIGNASGKRVGIQTIKPDGRKLFSKGMEKEGAFCVLGGPIGGTTYIAEGYATAASVAMSTGAPCVFALDAGNLPKVAQLLIEARPSAKFIVAADNDAKGVEAAVATGLPWRAPSQAGFDWNDVHASKGPLSVKTQLAKARAKVKRNLFEPIGSLSFKSPEWLIDGVLEDQTFAVCFGSPAAGKTFVTIDMALCIAAGVDYHGMSVRQGAVFYIASEGHNGFARRASAWSKARGVPLDGLPFFKSSRSVVLTDDEQVEQLIDVINEMAARYGKPALIVVDTLARAMGAADENSTKEMGALIETVDDVRDEFNCTVLAVHHTGHGNKERARGSSSLLGAVDCEFRVEKWSDEDPLAKVEVTWTKMKDAAMPPVMNFAHLEVDLIGADLEPATSVVMTPIDSSKPRSGGKVKLTDRQRMFVQIVESIGGPEGGCGVEQVRAKFYDFLSEETPRVKRQVFGRTIEALVAKDLIEHKRDEIYLK